MDKEDIAATEAAQARLAERKARASGAAAMAELVQGDVTRAREALGETMAQQTRLARPEPDDPILQFFAYEHLPPALQAVSAPFGVLAVNIVKTLPANPERAAALRLLLQAKDAAVRARLFR